MDATAVTYRTSERKSDLRTVLVTDVRESVVLLPSGSLDVVLGKLLHGSHCAHSWWDEVLGTSGDDFAIPAAQVVARRQMNNAAKPRFRAEFKDGQLTYTRDCH